MGFYEELFTSGGSCIGCGNGRDYDRWLKEMQNRHAGTVLPEGLCERASASAAKQASWQECTASNSSGRTKGAGFDRFLAVCDKDNLASEKAIFKNGGIREDKRYDKEEQVFVKRFWIDL